MAKCIILDSGALINLTTNGLLDVFKKLTTNFEGQFLITDSVKYETIEHPLNVKRFEWGAIRVKQLLSEEVIKLASEQALISQKELTNKTNSIMDLANSCITKQNRPVHLVERGECECLALSLILTKRGIENVVVIDERTARMLCEDPENLEKIMESKLETKLNLNLKKIEDLQKVKVIRSAELIYIANKKGILTNDKNTLEAILYALKFGGCSISEKEIQIMKKL